MPEKYAGDPSLGPITFRISHGGGDMLIDPNGMIVAAFEGKIEALEPLPDTASVISGHAAVLFTSDEFSASMTGKELRRFAMRTLSPQQYFALRAAVGSVFEIGPEFYAPGNGYALQPKEDHEELPDVIRIANFDR